ncbi:hypothetical protein FPV67DRAFT_1669251 [Lyophyllum atratum]|nr:hypothetical protein FPV67DRAFT_1669251 [Lyophyllum atratum]
MNLPSVKLNNLLDYMDELQTNPGEVFVALLHNDNFIDAGAITSIVKNISAILDGLISHSRARKATMDCVTQDVYEAEIMSLTGRDAGLHFVAAKTTEQRLQNANIDDMAGKMIDLAPHLWKLLDRLLSANTELNHRRTWRRAKTKKHKDARKAGNEGRGRDDAATEGDAEDDDYWQYVEADGGDLFDVNDDEPEDLEDQIEERFNALIKIARFMRHR